MIKKSYILMVTVLLIFSQSSFCLTKMFSGIIELPWTVANNDLSVFYNGQKLTIEVQPNSNFAQYSFVDLEKVQEVCLIITDAATCCVQESNNIACLKIAADTDYICYQLKALRITDENNETLLTWNIENKKLKDCIIPENSIIFLFDPNMISQIKIPTWKPENMFRMIPTIVINHEKSKEEFMQKINFSRLAAMDIDLFHRQENKTNYTTSTFATWIR